MNVYLFTKEELNDFLKGYDRYKEFVISVEQAEAMAWKRGIWLNHKSNFLHFHPTIRHFEKKLLDHLFLR